MTRHHGPWRRLVNTAASEGGSIHDDRQARQLGFRGALVPGSVVASAAMPLILERYGAPWMQGGWFTFTFMSPVYDAEEVQARAEDAGPRLDLQIASREGRVCCMGEAGLGSAAPWMENEPEWQDVFPDLERGFAFPSVTSL